MLNEQYNPTKTDEKRSHKERPHILNLVSMFVNDQFPDNNVTETTVKQCFHTAFKSDSQLVEHCYKLYEEYIPEQLAQDHIHFNYDSIFTNYVPFNTLVLMQEHQESVLTNSITAFQQYRLESPVVSMINFKDPNMGVPFESYDVTNTSYMFWLELRKRFATFVYFYNPASTEDVTITELFPYNNEYQKHSFTVTRSMFESMYGKYVNPVPLNARAEFYKVIGVDTKKIANANEFIAYQRQKGRLPISGDAYMFILCVLYYLFKHDSTASFQNANYTCLIASLCFPSRIHERSPAKTLYQKNRFPRMTKRVYQDFNQDVLFDFNMEQINTATRFIVGLKFCAQMNMWFNFPFSEETVVNAMLMFSGSRFARIWRDGHIDNLHDREKTTYKVLVDALKILL